VDRDVLPGLVEGNLLLKTGNGVKRQLLINRDAASVNIASARETIERSEQGASGERPVVEMDVTRTGRRRVLGWLFPSNVGVGANVD
jgi:hypothetical protein